MSWFLNPTPTPPLEAPRGLKAGVAAALEAEAEPKHGARGDAAPLDPLLCAMAASELALTRSGVDLAPAPVREAPASAAPVDLSAVMEGLVRRVCWGGDRRRGSARIELASGPLLGATLLVHADHGEVSIELELPSGVNGSEWAERLGGRLAQKGLRVSGVSVR